MAKRMVESKTAIGDLLADGFGRSFWLFLLFAVVSGFVCYQVKGSVAFEYALSRDLNLLASTLPRIVAAVSIAGLIWAILPTDKLTQYIGQDRGIKSLIVTMVVSILTPGGPSAAYPLLAMLGAAGADRGVLVTYITGWSMLGLQRILVWDIPFMGAEFSITRFLVCLPLPIIAGLIARKIPIKLSLNEPDNRARGQ
jgi:uncharacterized membrane protein YraQ (UPF0718 family)